MSVLFILIGFSLLLSLSFLIAFLWAYKKGQFDDTYTPAVRILFDDIKDEKKEKNKDRMENF